jgi:hypothetical protein
LLRWLIEATFVEKRVVQTLPGLRHEVELRPVSPSEMAVRAMLTKEPREGGLIGRLPVLQVETQGFAVAAPAAARQSAMMGDSVECARGAEVVARRANAGARLELEKARGAEVVARYQGRPAAVETPVEESIPVFAPAEANDVTGDPTSPPRA